MSEQNRIENQSSDHEYFTIIPNIVHMAGLDPYAHTLYSHLKKTAGENGCCWKSGQTLAEETGMSEGKVSESKKNLESCCLIRRERKRVKRKGQPVDHIIIIDIWDKNAEFLQLPKGARTRQAARDVLRGKKPSRDEGSDQKPSRGEDKPSRDEDSGKKPSRYEGKPSPGETNKIPEKEPKGEKDPGEKEAAAAASPAPQSAKPATHGPAPPLQVFKPGMDFLDMAAVTEEKQAEMQARGIDNPAAVAEPLADWSINDEDVREVLLEFMALSGLRPATRRKRKGWETGARECLKVFGDDVRQTLAAIGVFFRIRADDDDDKFKHEVYSPHSIVNGLGMIRDNGGNNDGRQRRVSGQPDGRKTGATGSGRAANRRSSPGVASEKDPYAVYRRRTRAAT